MTHAKHAKKTRTGRFFWLLLAVLVLAGTATLYLSLHPRGLTAVRAKIARIGDADIRAAFTKMAEKNPETLDYIAGFEGVTPCPEHVDLSADLTEGEIPLLMQWDSRWGYCKYGAGLIGYTGCGPTALSMVLLGLTGDETFSPAYVAKFSEDNGYCVIGNGTSWTLFSEGAEKLGLTAEELPLDEGVMRRRLADGQPIICIMGKGDFTDTGHYIVITGCGEEGFSVLDPNRKANCHDWDYDTLAPQIRNLWAYTA